MSEELIKNVNFILGAVDGKTLARVTRVVRLLQAHQWAIGELSLLCQHWDEEYRRDRLADIRSTLKIMIEKEDEILRNSGSD